MLFLKNLGSSKHTDCAPGDGRNNVFLNDSSSLCFRISLSLQSTPSVHPISIQNFVPQTGCSNLPYASRAFAFSGMLLKTNIHMLSFQSNNFIPMEMRKEILRKMYPLTDCTDYGGHMKNVLSSP